MKSHDCLHGSITWTQYPGGSHSVSFQDSLAKLLTLGPCCYQGQAPRSSGSKAPFHGMLQSSSPKFEILDSYFRESRGAVHCVLISLVLQSHSFCINPQINNLLENLCFKFCCDGKPGQDAD
ncbi:hypothetical protein MG293_015142 [Ovis ammon polii]|uniref:Uncharacterized protein n=1 Tax=Ovis ammon polii TaxID=230172 RepID=A0AAD4Y4Q8_OVIAM|nr:hypothetical protein MG293_015142 [Ovis ammon polii]